MLLEVKDKYILEPRLCSYNQKLYAIGGSITVERSAPKLPFTYKEATQEEYQELYALGVRKFFKTEEKNTNKNEKSRTGKSDTGTDKGPTPTE